MSEIDFLALVDSCLCTNIRKISRIITRIYDNYLQPSGININQLGLLLTIKGFNETGRESSIGEIGDRLIMEKSTLSRNLRKLEDADLLVLEPHPDNRSKKQVKITDQGMEVVLEAYGYWDQVQDRIRSTYGQQNFSDVVILLNKLQDVLLEEFATDLT